MEMLISLLVLMTGIVWSYRVDMNRRADTAFAALTSNGAVITWGEVDAGGNSSLVSIDLQSGVLDISSTSRAYACVKENGKVVTWGDPAFGGKSSHVKEMLSSNVAKVFATSAAFAALKNDGSVVTW